MKVERYSYTYTPSSFYGLLSHINLAILPRGISLRINRHSSHHKPGFVIFSFSPSLRGHARKPKPQSFIRLLLFFCDSFLLFLSLPFLFFTTSPTSRWIIFSAGTLFIQELRVHHRHVRFIRLSNFLFHLYKFVYRLRADDFIAV